MFRSLKNLTSQHGLLTTNIVRSVSHNTVRKLVPTKKELLTELPAVLPFTETTTVSTVTSFDTPTKVVTFEHPMPAHIATLNTVTAQDLFAVIDINGRQFKVTPGDKVMVNNLKGVEIGEQLAFDHVLLLGGRNFTKLGKPFVDKTTVVATVLEHTTTKEINVFKMKRRTGYRRLMRYHDQVTILSINSIKAEDIPTVATLESTPVNTLPNNTNVTVTTSI